jgi:hypothetical protein
MKTGWLGLVMVMAAMKVSAAVVVESGSATIRSDNAENGSRAGDAPPGILFVRRGEDGATRQLLLWKFDVAPYKGMTLTGDCMVSVGVNWAGMEAPFTLYQVTKPWEESTVSWETLVGVNGDHADVLSPALDTQAVGPVQGRPVIYSWRVPRDVAQRWLDKPDAFCGLALVAQADFIAHHYLTRRNGNRSLAACLVLALDGEERLAAAEQRLTAGITAQGAVFETMGAQIGADKPDENINSGDARVKSFTLLRGGGNMLPQMILWRFDLARYKGRAAKGDAYVSCGLLWSEMEAAFALYEVQAAWHETNVTWRNMVIKEGGLARVLGSPLDEQPVGAVRGTNAFYVWRVPGAFVQRWLDAPEGNYGVALVAAGVRVNHVFPTRNFPNARMRPSLWAGMLDHAPERPEHVAPISFATVATAQVELQAAPFEDKDTGDRHTASRWLLSVEDAAGAEQWGVFAQDGARVATLPVSLVWEWETQDGALTKARVPAERIEAGRPYFWRVQYCDNNGRWSEQSLPTAFVAGGQGAVQAVAAEEAVAVAPDAQEKRSGRMWWSVLAVAALIVVAGGFYMVVSWRR